MITLLVQTDHSLGLGEISPRSQDPAVVRYPSLEHFHKPVKLPPLKILLFIQTEFWGMCLNGMRAPPCLDLPMDLYHRDSDGREGQAPAAQRLQPGEV